MKAKTQNSQNGKCHPDRAEWKLLFILSLVDDFEDYVFWPYLWTCIRCCYLQHLYAFVSLTVDTMLKMFKIN